MKVKIRARKKEIRTKKRSRDADVREREREERERERRETLFFLWTAPFGDAGFLYSRPERLEKLGKLTTLFELYRYDDDAK